MNHKYMLWQQLDPTGVTKPFRIIESYSTCEGTRWRITNHCFGTEIEARDCLYKMREGRFE